jgi:hypothetical protein
MRGGRLPFVDARSCGPVYSSYYPDRSRYPTAYIMLVFSMDANLVLFAEKAHILETSSFWKWLSTTRGPADIERIVNGEWLAHEGLNQEALAFFCLNLRFLIQPRDGFSIQQIDSIADTWPDDYALQRSEIHRAVSRLRSELDASCLVQFLDGQKTSNENLFDIIFYGELVHANPSKREQFKNLRTSGLFSYFAFQAFTHVLFQYRNCIQTLAFQIVQYLDLVDCHAKKANLSVNTNLAHKAHEVSYLKR